MVQRFKPTDKADIRKLPLLYDIIEEQFQFTTNNDCTKHASQTVFKTIIMTNITVLKGFYNCTDVSNTFFLLSRQSLGQTRVRSVSGAEANHSAFHGELHLMGRIVRWGQRTR